MPKFAVSNIALNAFDHAAELERLPELGLQGLEVAPGRVWRDTWPGPAPQQVEAYRRQAETASLKVIGLHSIFYDHPELGLFRDRETRSRTMDFMEHLSAVCRDLGGKTIIYGGGRRRNNTPLDEATKEAVGFLGELCRRIEGHGVCYCFEPLGPQDADFINSAFESLDIVNSINHPALQVQLDAKALVDNNEAEPATFRAVAKHLVHFHANEPGLGVLGVSGAVDHAAMGRMLDDIGYDGFVSIEQRMLNEADPLADIARSAAVLKECYR